MLAKNITSVKVVSGFPIFLWTLISVALANIFIELPNAPNPGSETKIEKCIRSNEIIEQVELRQKETDLIITRIESMNELNALKERNEKLENDVNELKALLDTKQTELDSAIATIEGRSKKLIQPYITAATPTTNT